MLFPSLSAAMGVLMTASAILLISVILVSATSAMQRMIDG